MSATLQHIYPPAPTTERGKPSSIGGDPKNKKKLIYTVGRSVVIRDAKNPLDCWIYQEHKYETTCARFAPSGFYVCSADKSSRLLVWDCVGSDKVIKLDKQTIGTISDIAWTEDSKRIAVGGAGREKMGECFLFDSGASVGEITGHAQPVTSVDIKQTRPYRLATGSEDFKMNWFEGPPFKYKSSVTNHTRYINSVRFSPDGNRLVTVGSDKKGFIYDGKEGKQVAELSSAGGHGGSIFSVAWSPDSKKVATASGDKTVKIWNGETGELLQTFNFFGNDVSSQQTAILWQGEEIYSVSLQGSISVLDEFSNDRPRRVHHGHNKIVAALAYDVTTDKLYTSDTAAYFIEWEAATGATNVFSGPAHTSAVPQMKVVGGNLVSISIDDTIKFSSLSTRQLGEGIALGSQPNGVDGNSNVVVVSTNDSLVVIENEKIIFKLPVPFDPSCIALSPDRTEVAAGSKADQLIHVFSLEGGELKEKFNIEGHRGNVTALAYSPDSRYLAAGDSNREVKVFEGQKPIVDGWVFHTSKIMSVSWAPDCVHLVSGSVDSAAIVWNIQEPKKFIHMKLAHQGGVRSVLFRNSNNVISVGEDCCMKSWTLNY